MTPLHLPAVNSVRAHLRRGDQAAALAAVVDAFTRGAEDAQPALSVLACSMAVTATAGRAGAAVR